MRILLIEDESNEAVLIRRYLNGSPHQILHVETAEEARAAITHHPDLVLVDMLLGQSREGFDLVKEFRDYGYQNPIVAVTGLSLPSDLELCEAVGCTDLLQKPYTIRQLADTLEKYLA